MTTFGYRLFSFEVFPGLRQTSVKLNDCNGESYSDIAERLLKTLTAGITVGDPSEPGQIKIATEGSLGAPAIRVEDVYIEGNTLRGRLWSGKIGSHEKALGEDADSDSDIKEKAASNIFRFIFAFPDDGNLGILAMETISRSCPAPFLARWLQKKSRDEASQTSPSNRWWRIKVAPLADEERLEEMIREGLAQKLVLVKNTITAGSTREVREIEIKGSLAVSGKLDQVVQVVQGWRRRYKESENSEATPVSTAQGVQELAAIMGPEIANLDLDDGWVEIEDPDGQIKRVRPGQMADVFTYRLSENIPVVTASFYAEVRETAVALQPAAKIAIDWPVS
ncbi:hypothetical protein AB0399_39285 [Streptomyces sp. NPDC088194]|uniref:hypothetical protein n=1 Tax=Streptomyces sp. NPDC088194 TaxID=3154931 RepID=UPI00344FD3FA